MWAAAYREDQRTRHIYQVAVRSPAARHQLRDAKLSFDDGKVFHLSTMGKRVLVPRTLVTSIVAMYHESVFYGHSGVLRTMALIKRDYVCSHLRHYVERYILWGAPLEALRWNPPLLAEILITSWFPTQNLLT